ncbi:glycosyltransferase family 4 protein [Tichowtungia aerotolerans]|uniref:Glycosyltransferase n=1 Tax=Tichowtungia aerotolerans TaxID=2697043 RepID=A0A6P1MFB5_9BACT|nr:glycosyltransferase family 4 protein [Tichowtungia aerotolerans]QHI70306.1 glycosyltransferase [Tichowtungia aerotolerans]
MKLAFGHHRNFLHQGETRPGTFGLHTAAENIALSLEAETGSIEQLGPLRNLCSPIAAARIAGYQRICSRLYYGWAEPSLSRNYGRQMARKLKYSDVDVVLCNETKHAAYLHTDRKVALWTDTLYGGIFDYYQTFSNLCSRTRRAMEQMDRAAVENCDLLVFASDWASQNAIRLYGANPDKVKTIPYGANFTSGMTRNEAENLVESKRFDGPCRLLFAGVEWTRKGGDTAIRVVEKLRSSGISVEITFLGTDPGKHMDSIPEFVHCAGFLSLNKPDELEKMKQLYRNAHFLLQPCRAECFGHIFPEANSFALPAIASNTGGIPTAVHDGINGYCVNVEDVDAYANRISEHFQSPEKYRALSINAFDDYHNRLSWQKSVQTLIRTLEK